MTGPFLPMVLLLTSTAFAQAKAGTPIASQPTTAVAGKAGLATGPWRAALACPGGSLPFGLVFEASATGLRCAIQNGPESIPVQARLDRQRQQLVLDFAPYDSRIEARVAGDGRRLLGVWKKRRSPGKHVQMDFVATAGAQRRFLRAGLGGKGKLQGRWRVQFEKDKHPSVGIFRSRANGVLLGTFLTTLGDYRYLAGNADGNRLQLSCFDGAHAFLFRAELKGGRLHGDFWSSNTWHESWTAQPDEDARLPDAFDLTRWNAKADLRQLRYPDLQGVHRSLADRSMGQGSARLLVVFGSWCPNCRDCSLWMKELHHRYTKKGLVIVGLAFEHAADAASRAARAQDYAKRLGLPYPVLVAGRSDKAMASKAFPALDRVRAYPTTIFLSAKNEVMAVHTGFAGPATGPAHDRLRRRFVEIIDGMLKN